MEQDYINYLKNTKYSFKQFSIENCDNKKNFEKYLNTIKELIKKDKNIIFYSLDKLIALYHGTANLLNFYMIKFSSLSCNRNLVTFLMYDDNIDGVKSLVCDLEIKDDFNKLKSWLNTEKEYDKNCSICFEFKDKMIRCPICTNSTCKECINEDCKKNNLENIICTKCRAEYYIN